MGNVKKNFAILILLFVNLIFLYKYSLRITNYAILISVFVVCLQYLFFRFSYKLNTSNRLMLVFYYGIFSLLLTMVVFSFLEIPLSSLNVDRWSVIYSFIDEALKGNYPYFAKSHHNNYPGPMPFYFLLVFPFYLFGELAVFSALGYAMIVIVIIKRKVPDHTGLLFYLATSGFVFWEIATRSNIFTNSIFIALLFTALIKLKLGYRSNFYWLALLSGLLLCTRSNYILTYIIFFIPILLKREFDLNKLIKFVLIAIIGFSIPFIPILFFFWSDFFIMNPFIIQSTYFLPNIYTVVFLLISVILAFFVNNKLDVFFYSGLVLFICILIYSIYYIVDLGFKEAFIESVIDISYFIFCVPFLLFYLMQFDEISSKSTNIILK